MRPEKFLTNREVRERFEAGNLKIGDCYGHNLPYDSWFTVTEVLPDGWTASDQIGSTEKVTCLGVES